MEEEKRASSTPSKYIWNVLGGRLFIVLDLRFAKDGRVLVTRPLLLFTDHAAVKQITAVDRFILYSISDVVFNK